VSARWDRATEGGEASNGARTTQTYILGIGASGALLAGAGVALISLVGLVSFDVWPGTPSSAAPEEAQLNFGSNAVSQPAEGAPLSEAAGILADATPPGAGGAPSTGGGGGGAGGDDQEKQPVDDGEEPPAPPAPAPSAPYVPPPDEADGSTGGSKEEGKSDPRHGDEGGDPIDDPDEPDPVQPPSKDLPGRSGDGDGDDSKGGSPDRRHCRREAPDAVAQASSPTSSTAYPAQGSRADTGSRHGRRG
jgi:hypothetical protein